MKRVIFCAVISIVILSFFGCNRKTELTLLAENEAVSVVYDYLLAPEDAALELATMYVESLKKEAEGRSYVITEYEDLYIKNLWRTTELDDEMISVFGLDDDEIGENKWLLELSFRFRYEGTLSPIGPSNGEWFSVLHQRSPMGYLMEKEGNDYSLYSRYE